MRALNNVLVTGGSGFIGSNFVIYLFEQDDFKGKVINLDKLTYAGNHKNLISMDPLKFVLAKGNIRIRPELLADDKIEKTSNFENPYSKHLGYIRNI